MRTYNIAIVHRDGTSHSYLNVDNNERERIARRFILDKDFVLIYIVDDTGMLITASSNIADVLKEWRDTWAEEIGTRKIPQSAVSKRPTKKKGINDNGLFVDDTGKEWRMSPIPEP